ncbi:hypothetical protein [Kitasatospora sp. NPDC004272]
MPRNKRTRQAPQIARQGAQPHPLMPPLSNLLIIIVVIIVLDLTTVLVPDTRPLLVQALPLTGGLAIKISQRRIAGR